MRSAKKRDTFSDAIEPDDKVVVAGDSSKAAPPASLTSDIFRRGQENARAANALTSEHPAAPSEPAQTCDARAQQAILEDAFAADQPPPEAADATPSEAEPSSDLPAQSVTEPVYEPASDALGEVLNTLAVEYQNASAADTAPAPPAPDADDRQAPAEEPVERDFVPAATRPIERSEFQSLRESAAEWTLIRAPSAGFWDRFMRDVSLFIIFFAVLVFVVLQIV